MRVRICIFLMLLLYSCDTRSAAVVNGVTGGRVGDKLLTYIRAYWVAWKHGIDLAVRHFPYADHLALWNDRVLELHNTNHEVSKLARMEDVDINSLALYEVGLYFSQPEWKYPHDVTSWSGLIDNKAFIKELRKKITPCASLALPPLPPDRATVAIHIRRGGGFDAPLLSENVAKVVVAENILFRESRIDQEALFQDTLCEAVVPVCHKHMILHHKKRTRFSGRRSRRPYSKRRPRPHYYADRGDPLKFPPLSFYADALQLLVDDRPDVPLYVYIFTDDRNPIVLQNYFEDIFKEQNIVFDCRVEGNSHDQNVLADMFDMARFDYLIRPDSSYSKVAQLIGNYKMVLYAHEARWYGNVLKIIKIMKARSNRMTIVSRE